MTREGTVLSKEAAVARLRELLHEPQFGTLNCMVLRVFRSDAHMLVHRLIHRNGGELAVAASLRTSATQKSGRGKVICFPDVG